VSKDYTCLFCGQNMSIKNLIKNLFYQNYPAKTSSPQLKLMRNICLYPMHVDLKQRVSAFHQFFSAITFFLIVIFSLNSEAAARSEYHWTYNLEKGRKQFAAKMYNDAYDSMKMALKKNPRSNEAANILGLISLMKKDMYSAEKYFLNSLEIDDSQPDIHTSMGKIDEYFQRDESAMAHYKKSVFLNPDNPKALINLSRIYFKREEPSEAEKYFKLCYNMGISKSTEIYNIADGMRKKNPSGAALEFKKAIEVNPAHIAAYIRLADSYRQTGSYDDAIAVLEELKSNRPDYALTYIYLGNIYFNNKLAMQRRKYFINLSILNYQKAIKLDPANADVYFQLSEIYKLTGERDKAAELELKGQETLRNEKAARPE